jgi:CheY-like chemotaxis protein
MSAPPLRVMLVDDHEVVRDGIRLLLNEAEDVVVCAEASSAREAVAVAAQALPAPASRPPATSAPPAPRPPC